MGTSIREEQGHLKLKGKGKTESLKLGQDLFIFF